MVPPTPTGCTSVAVNFEPLWRRTVRTLKSYPLPRWKFADIIRGRTRPAERVTELCLAAARAGAPRDDVLTVPREIARRIENVYPQVIPPLSECVRSETELEGFANAAEVLALITPTKTNLERARDRILAHEYAERQLLTRIDQELLS